MNRNERRLDLGWRPWILAAVWMAEAGCLPPETFDDPIRGKGIVSIEAVPFDFPSEGKIDAPAISGDGQVVAFVFLGSGPGKIREEGRSELYLHETRIRITKRFVKGWDGSPPNGNSGTPVPSGDGRIIAFESLASNLVPGDTNGQPDVFVYDSRADRILQVSRSTDGRPGNADSFDPWISEDGRFVTFVSDSTNLVEDDTNGRLDVFLHDLADGTTVRVNRPRRGPEPDGDSYSSSVSADGRIIAFKSNATNLVPRDTNGKVDVFVWNRDTGRIIRASVAADGTEANGHSVGSFISGNDRHVVFQSYADNLVEGDTNGLPDIFVHDLETRKTRRINIAWNGGEANGESFFPSISRDGRFVAFHSLASNLVLGDTNGKSDVFVRDLSEGTIRMVSRAADGGPANGASYSPMINGTGRFVTFASNATNLTGPDGPPQTRVFIAFLP